MAYFDDSGTHAGSPAVVWGGLIGTEEQWNHFDSAWRQILLNPSPGRPELSQFSVGDCKRRDGEFLGYGQGESDHLRYRFRDVIKKSGVSSIAFLAPYAEWDAVPRSYEVCGSPEKWTMEGALWSAVNYAKKLGVNDLAVCFDAGQQSAKNTAIVAEILSGMSDAERPTIVWASVKKFPPLQGADTIATEIYWALAQVIEKRFMNFTVTLNSLALEYNLMIFIALRENIRHQVIKTTSPWYNDYIHWGTVTPRFI